MISQILIYETETQVILQYTTILEGKQDDQTAEMEMYGHISE